MRFSRPNMVMSVMAGAKNVASVPISRSGREKFSIAGPSRGKDGEVLPDAGDTFTLSGQVRIGATQYATLNFNQTHCNRWHTHFHDHSDTIQIPMRVEGVGDEWLCVKLSCVELRLADAFSLIHDIKSAAVRAVSHAVFKLWHALRVHVPPRSSEAEFVVPDDEMPQHGNSERAINGEGAAAKLQPQVSRS